MNALSRSKHTTIERLDGLLELAQALNHDLCIFDLETTGFSIYKEDIVEAAYIWIGQDGQSEAFSALINPGYNSYIPEEASDVHGVRDEDVEHAPRLEAFLGAFEYIFHNAVLSGYNVRQYDIPMMRNCAARFSVKLPEEVNILDVRDAWCKIQGTRKGNLTAVAQHYGVKAGPAHEGMGDVLTTARILDAKVKRHGIDAVLECARMGRPMPASTLFPTPTA